MDIEDPWTRWMKIVDVWMGHEDKDVSSTFQKRVNDYMRASFSRITYVKELNVVIYIQRNWVASSNPEPTKKSGSLHHIWMQ